MNPTITPATVDERSVSVTDTRKAALQRQTCMDYAFCLFNFNCIGRCYGRRLLQSGTIRQDHPLHNDDHARKYLPMFNTMSLSIKSIETLYEVFQLIDADNSGEIDLDEFLFFFRLQKSRFAKRAFSCIDADGSGEIDFGEFVLGLYNFCTCDNLSLCRFAFDIYDEDASGMLDHDEILHIVKDLYGRKGFKRNPSAQKTIEQLQTMNWYCSQGGEIVTAGEEVDFNAFFQFSKNHPSMLYPAFRMQYDLQSKVLGAGFWQMAALQRKEVEKLVGTDNDLIGALQAMHAKEEEYGGGSLGSPDSFGTEGGGKNEEILWLDENEPNITVAEGQSAKSEMGGGTSRGLTRSILRSKYAVGSTCKNKAAKQINKKTPPSKKKAAKKEELKALYKKELRAERHALEKGHDPKRAKQKATNKFMDKLAVNKKKKEKSLDIKMIKEVGLMQKDGSMAWQCQRCKHANYAVEKCATCSLDRGSIRSVHMLPLSPKRKKLRRSKTSF